MILILKECLAKRGLSLHPSKCKVQTNMESWKKRGDVLIEPGFSVHILPEGEPLVLLGTALSLTDATGTEVAHRTASAWRMFWASQRLLLNKQASLKNRLRLFDATVGSCALWCNESWTLRRAEEQQLQVAQRAMLRRIVGISRRPEEPWEDWVRRATHRAISLANAAKVRDWVRTHYERRWLWAGHVARRPAEAIIWRTTAWRDAEWCALLEEAGMERPLRPDRRRWMKWESSIRNFCSQRGLGWWATVAQRREDWAELAKEYNKFVREGFV